MQYNIDYGRNQFKILITIGICSSHAIGRGEYFKMPMLVDGDINCVFQLCGWQEKYVFVPKAKIGRQ